MKNGKTPNPNTVHPIAGYDKEIYVKAAIKNPNIIVGDFTYIADSEFEGHCLLCRHDSLTHDGKFLLAALCTAERYVKFQFISRFRSAVTCFGITGTNKGERR